MKGNVKTIYYVNSEVVKLKKTIVFIGILILGISFILFKPKEEIIVEANEEIEKLPIAEVKVSEKVEIKGMIKNPGVYEINENDRVIDLIEKAGGLLEDSNTSILNLSKKLKDEMVVIIYSNKEIEELKQDKIVIKYEEVLVPCECPDSINDACIEKENTDNKKIININTATKEELMTLPSIGESKAENIINYRENFKFETIEQIKEVSGIGESLFEKIKDYITI